MLEYIFLGFALLLWLPSSTTGPDQPFASGFEDSMHISVDRPESLVWTIDSTNHNATVVTSASYLTDGKVAIPTRFTWDVGAQTILRATYSFRDPLSRYALRSSRRS